MDYRNETDITTLLELLRLNGFFNAAGQAEKARRATSHTPYQPPKLFVVDLLNADGTIAHLGCGYGVEVESER
jgi:hypothetical protein